MNRQIWDLCPGDPSTTTRNREGAAYLFATSAVVKVLAPMAAPDSPTKTNNPLQPSLGEICLAHIISNQVFRRRALNPTIKHLHRSGDEIMSQSYRACGTLHFWYVKIK